MNIVLDDRLVDKRKRGFSERLLTWPWHPFKMYEINPSPKILQYNETHLVMHPATFDKAKHFLEDEK